MNADEFNLDGSPSGDSNARLGPTDRSIALLLDRAGAEERAGWSEHDSVRVARATLPLIAHAQADREANDPDHGIRAASELNVIAPGVHRHARGDRSGAGSNAHRALNGMRAWSGWSRGSAIAAMLAIVGGALVLSQTGRNAVPAFTHSPSSVAASGSDDAIDGDELEYELAEWLESAIRIDSTTLLPASTDDAAIVSIAEGWEADDLDALEGDLASFWSMRSDLLDLELNSTNSNPDAEGTL